MKYFLSAFLFFTCFQLSYSQNTHQGESGKSNVEITKLNNYKNRNSYEIDLSNLTGAERSRLINKLYASKNLAVISRLDSRNFLKISTSQQVSEQEIQNEINSILNEINSASGAAPEKF